MEEAACGRGPLSRQAMACGSRSAPHTVPCDPIYDRICIHRHDKTSEPQNGSTNYAHFTPQAKGRDNVVVTAIGLSSKGHSMGCRNLRRTYLLEVVLTHILASYETLYIVCRVGIQVGFPSVITSLGL